MEDDGGGDGGEGNGGFSPNSSFGAFPEMPMDLDLDLDLDELFFDGCWLETTDLKQSEETASASNAMNDNTPFLYFAENPFQENVPNEETERTANQEPLNQAATSSEQAEKFLLEEAEVARRWWIAPRGSEGPSSSVKERLLRAISGLDEAVPDKDFLVQIWVPFQQEGKNFLTTLAQPHLFNQKYSSLAKYRHVSETYNFPADEGSTEVGLPGRVFLQKMPEWTPDVRFFRSEEYPRIKEAQKCDVRGSLAVPVFERGSGTCLGVVEIITTTQKMNYRPELENICKALEAVDLRSSSNLKTPSTEVYNDFYYVALPEISDFLATVCRSYDLPLALSWAPCDRQGKGGSRHSDENFSQCVSTIDSACFVLDEQSKCFLEACSEYHLLQGEGMVGKAFKETKLFFVPEVTIFSKTNYALAHHAKVSGLHAALAVPLKSKSNGLVEFVLEFFFPKACIDTEAKQEMLKSLSVTLQQDFRSSNLVIDKDLELEVVLPDGEDMVLSESPVNGAETEGSLREVHMQDSTMIKANEKGKDPKDESKLSSGLDNSQLDSVPNNVPSGAEPGGLRVDAGPSTEPASTGGGSMLGSRRPGDKRRSKNEKIIGLEAPRNNEMALPENQEGWAFVEETASRYGLSSSNGPFLKSKEQLQHLAEDKPAPRSPSSSCSGSSTNTANTLQVADAVLKKAHSEAEPHKIIKEPPLLENLAGSSSNKSLRAGGGIKVKATFGEAIIRFTLPPSWGYRELEQEIARRFSIDNVSWFDLKYLDDDKELVLLKCEGDLEECIDIHRSSQSQTIKISLHDAFQVKLGGSFGSTGAY
ncbi:hypothetical protein DY000_02005466 [Brassica cretica]|uniref:PB1 domain-containing protein n=1 Tax=Brassica cretica TaxID=69181 RepID=A0ABQ7CJT3_BRACR|nr:hypothetical protein DY000_02005466 [Brassica cretica]